MNYIDYEVTASVYKKMLFLVISDEEKKRKTSVTRTKTLVILNQNQT